MNDDQITPPAADPADTSPPARRRAAPRAASRRKSADVPDTPEKPVGPAAGDAPASPQGDAPPTLAEATPRKRAAGKAKSPRAPSRRAPRGSARPPEPDNLSDTPPELPAARLAAPQAELVLEPSAVRSDGAVMADEALPVVPREPAAADPESRPEPAADAPDEAASSDDPTAPITAEGAVPEAGDESGGPRRKRKRRRGRGGSDTDGDAAVSDGEAADAALMDSAAEALAPSFADAIPEPAEPPPLTVVSLGLDLPPALSAAAREALAGARVILGTAEALDRLSGLSLSAPQRLCGAETAHLDVRNAGHAGAVLVCVGDGAGDGPAAELLADLGPAHVRVLPGVGRVQAACAALGLSAEIVTLVDLRRAPLAALRGQLRAHRLLAVPVADAERPAAVARLLLESGFPGARVWVCEFNGTAPRATAWLASELVELREPLDPHAVLIVATGPSAGVFTELPGLSAAALGDDAGAALPLAVRVLALAWLQPAAWETGWAISDGEASVALEWARAVPTARVRAVGVDPTLLGLSLARVGVGENLAAIPSAMPIHAAAWPAPEAVFIRGSAGLPEWLAMAWARLAPGGRLVVSAEDDQARADLVTFAAQVPAEAWQELSQSRGECVAGRLRFVPDAPVRLALWRKPAT
ncbi:MAG TPA: SAM-dependent methyltransferase [Rhodocyclaceae bacterium]|nr:SAM-dependent methyltransferase [Rhodocyclaceae bacterium]